MTEQRNKATDHAPVQDERVERAQRIIAECTPPMLETMGLVMAERIRRASVAGAITGAVGGALVGGPLGIPSGVSIDIE